MKKTSALVAEECPSIEAVAREPLVKTAIWKWLGW
jgi:hypothetical protein